jgi:chaperone modulatory protein CbpM
MEPDDHFAPVLVLDQECLLTLGELAELSGLERTLIQELAEAGLLTMAPGRDQTFTALSLTVARRARRLRADFALEESGVVLALTLLQRIEALEAKVRELQCRSGQ